MKLRFLLCFFFSIFFSIQANSTTKDSVLVYEFPIQREIGPYAWRITEKAFKTAEELDADYVLINMNTYGGMLDAADSIRSRILRSKIPVYVFINNNAASAGALISIACNKIFMVPSANIGAATVVDQKGEVLPDKYQSYMRSLMRSTAETRNRDPQIAQAMVDPRISVPGIIDSTKVLTFTAKEALKNNFCDGIVNTVPELLSKEGIENYNIVQFKESTIDKIVSFFINPFVSGILIMIIIGGLYFEIQSPGIGFPILAALIAAVLFFIPYYIEGLAAHWEIIIFIVGILLLGVELFIIPGFGVAGILGIIFVIFSLTLAMMGSLDFNINPEGPGRFFRALLIVTSFSFASLIISFLVAKKIFESRRKSFLTLSSVQSKDEGFLAVDSSLNELIGKVAITTSVLRPAGKISFGDETYDATALFGFIDKDVEVRIVKFENAQLYVEKI
ncbi:MAG: nodulation protein NfeD [Bacteroidales bacterium]